MEVEDLTQKDSEAIQEWLKVTDLFAAKFGSEILSDLIVVTAEEIKKSREKRLIADFRLRAQKQVESLRK